MQYTKYCAVIILLKATFPAFIFPVPIVKGKNK
jgi:hypothetical protein